ncbi:hypothetical protein [Actinospica robiniae]|uniref:hypothetical protein n=1 Tax=Actinospica robiniae TaxID=304901 RepID=UPI0004160541|nr:hypothetical protein [Actinospica robiniae]
MSDVQVDPSELARAERSVGFWDRLPFSFGEQPRSHVVIRTARQAGFRTGEAKIAVHNGRITRAPGVEVPDAVLTALSPNYRSADDPLTAIETAHGPFAGHTVAVTRAHRGTADFPTDRGPRTFPAYVLELEDTLGPAVVLDPGLARHSVAGVDGVFVVRVRDVSGVSDGEARPGLGGTPGDERREARLADDGRTLTVAFMASPEIYTDYPSAHVVEGRNAVAVIPIAVDRPLPEPETEPEPEPQPESPHRKRVIRTRLAYAQLREVTAVLAEPLGDRVVVDWLSGRPLSM